MAINWGNIGQGIADFAGNAAGVGKNVAGQGWSGAQQLPRVAWDATIPLNVKPPYAPRDFPIGKAVIGGTGLYAGTKFIAYPALAATGVISPEMQGEIGGNGVGRFFTTEQEIDPRRDYEIAEARGERYQAKILQQQKEEQARLWAQEQERAQYYQDQAYSQAQKMGELGLGLGTVATYRDVHAGQLRDSTRNYIDSMRVGNEAIGRILAPAPAVI